MATPGSGTAAPGAMPPGGPAGGPPDPSMIPLLLTDAALYYAHNFAGVGIALNILAFLVFSGRIWTRSYPVFRMGLDDYFMIAAYLFVLTDSVLLLLTVPFAFGRDPSTFTLADAQRSNMYAVIAQPIWTWCMCATKTSIALMLLRLETAKSMRRFLYLNIALQFVLGLYNTLAQVLQCIPLHAAWDLLGVVPAKCWSKEAIRINSICVSSIHVTTDFIFALLPISFLRKVQRPLRERVIIGMLMALGMFAGAASIIKLVAASRFGRTDDQTRESIQIGMWSAIEGLVGLIAACIPCLRSPFQRALEYFGLVTTHAKSTAYGQGYNNVYGESRSRRTKTHRSQLSENGRSASTASAMGIKMNSLRSPDAQSEEGILPQEEKGTPEIWCTTEVHMEEEARKMSRVGDIEERGRRL